MLKSRALIEEINRNHEYFEKDTLGDLLILLIEERKLQDYIGDFSFDTQTDDKYQAIYSAADLRLEIYLNNINNYFNNLVNSSKLPIKQQSLVRYYNMNILNIIYHQLEHANQNKKSIEIGASDSLNTIIQEGMKLGRKFPNNLSTKDELLYSRFYKYILTERNAEIIALINTLDIYKGEEYLLYKLINLLLTGYSKGSSLAEKYYVLIEKKEEFSKISFVEDYDNLTNLSWGMPISNRLFMELRYIKENEDVKKLEKTLGVSLI